jgi:hypothetical protein
VQVSGTIVSDGNSSPTYRWAVALHTIEVGVSLPILDEKDAGHPASKITAIFSAL